MPDRDEKVKNLPCQYCGHRGDTERFDNLNLHGPRAVFRCRTKAECVRRQRQRAEAHDA